MTRISQQTLYAKINFDLNRMTQELSRINESIASGKRVNRPSDDILGGANIMIMRNVLDDIGQYQRDLSMAKNWHVISEAAILNMKTSITEAKILAEQMSTGTYRDSNLDAAALQIDNIISEIIQLGNTDQEGRYIFAGAKTNLAPFSRVLNILDPVSSLTANSVYTGDVTSSGTYTGTLTKQYMVRVTTAGGSEVPNASLTTNLDVSNDDLTFTAKTAGPTGTAITIEYVDPAAINQLLAINTVGDVITISLATDAGGIITSTARKIMAAMNTDSAASALVATSLAAGNAGNGVVSAMGPTNLTQAQTNATLSVNFASAETGLTGTNNDLRIMAVTDGSGGDNISIRYTDPGTATQPLTILVSQNDIVVNLATDASGAISSTAAEVRAAINGDPTAGAMIQASDLGADDGTGVVTAMGKTYLDTGTHNDLGFVSITPGSDGNLISITYQDPGAASQATSASVINSGGGAYEVVVVLGTDATGSLNATANEVMAQIDIAAGNLVNTTLAPGNSGLGVVNQVGTWALTGGTSTAAMFQVSEDGGLTWGPADDFIASTTGTNIYDSNLTDGDMGAAIAFSNDGPLSVGDTFTFDVSHYTGDLQNLEVNIQRNYRVRMNVNGEEALGGVGDRDNVLDSLFRLHTALLAHDSLAVADELPILDTVLESFAGQMAQTGVRINRADVAENILETSKMTATQRLSDNEDIDLIETINALQLQQMAYQAALAATSIITSLSLLDYIR